MGKATFKNAWPYQDDVMALPVADVESAVPFYEKMLGFRVVERADAPHRSAVLERDGLRIGLNENGRDPAQDGVAFEVYDADAAYAEFIANGLAPAEPGKRDPNGTISAEMGSENRSGIAWRVFFIVAPDGLCYWIGSKGS